ncbi:prepilin peptidase [Micromonospora sp. SL4-19]|uniref:prepilin peptidase n=1 Tax=Micromonospora sp. SL4-19 TaxID=3399129 RepID=UPI003A4D6B69
MSAGLVSVAALLGALAGWAAIPFAGRFTDAERGEAPAGVLAAAGSDPGDKGRRVGRLAVAAVGAVVFGGLALVREADPALPVFLLVAAVGLVLALVDLACLRLPDPLVALAVGCGGLGLVAVALITGTPDRLFPALAGAAASFAGYVLLALLPGSRLGFGDVKLAVALGLPLGWLGWPTLALGLLLPHLLNGVVVLALLATRKVRRDTALPFGPAILAGAWLAVLFA